MPRKAATAELAEQVEARTQQQATGRTMDEWLEHYSADFAAALPAHVDSDRFLRLALNELRWKPELRDCDLFSVIGAVMTCAQLGLEPSGPLNHVYMTPRNVNIAPKGQPKAWVKKVQLTVGYQGYIELAGRTGAVKNIAARAVYEGDQFDFEYGLEDRIVHKPTLGPDRGDIVAAYAVARMVNGDYIPEVIDLDTIHRARDASDAYRRGYGPWIDHFEAMVRKTAVRRLWTWLPKTEAGAAAYAWDGHVIDAVPAGRDVLEVPKVPVLDVVTEVGHSEEPEPVEPVVVSADSEDTPAADSEDDPTRPFEGPDSD